ncbi:MFS transporter [Asanoa sp. NPDC050611]|uniref:MFS transporter n=1 Tax=Asanoa sp. NPDC050611 TaxID=3157098 RepID=UPI0033CFC4A2
MTATATTTANADARPRAGQLGLLALCSAVGVGTIYFPQALIADVTTSLHVPIDQAALVVTAPQAGYALGILILVPLADTGVHRRLLLALFLGTAVCAGVAALAPSLSVLLVASLLMGCAAVAAPVIGPYVADRTGPSRLGSVSGVLLSAAIAGMIASRAVAGHLSQYSWRYAYAAAAVLAVLCAMAVWSIVPRPAAVTPLSFPGYLRRPVDRLLAGPDLRRSAFYQACVFAAFTGTWATLAITLRQDHNLGATAMSWVGLVVVATMVVVPASGRAVDRWGPEPVTTWALVGTLVAAGLLAGAVVRGTAGLVLLVAGVLVLDVAMQTGMIANVTRMYRCGSGARSAMNTAYMVCAFLAGSLGSWVAVRLYHAAGWWTVPVMAAILAAVAAVVHATAVHTRQAHG